MLLCFILKAVRDIRELSFFTGREGAVCLWGGGGPEFFALGRVLETASTTERTSLKITECPVRLSIVLALLTGNKNMMNLDEKIL